MKTSFIKEVGLQKPENLYFNLALKYKLHEREKKKYSKRTMVENGKKHRQNSHLIIRFPTSEGVSEVSERVNE